MFCCRNKVNAFLLMSSSTKRQNKSAQVLGTWTQRQTNYATSVGLATVASLVSVYVSVTEWCLGSAPPQLCSSTAYLESLVISFLINSRSAGNTRSFQTGLRRSSSPSPWWYSGVLGLWSNRSRSSHQLQYVLYSGTLSKLSFNLFFSRFFFFFETWTELTD